MTLALRVLLLVAVVASVLLATLSRDTAWMMWFFLGTAACLIAAAVFAEELTA